MRYMITFFNDEQSWAETPPAEQAKVMAQHERVTRELKAAGKYVCCASLGPAAGARTIRWMNRQRVVVDGPFAETKELLGGFYIVDAESPAEAVEWAMKLPQLAFCTTEVRPIGDME